MNNRSRTIGNDPTNPSTGRGIISDRGSDVRYLVYKWWVDSDEVMYYYNLTPFFHLAFPQQDPLKIPNVGPETYRKAKARIDALAARQGRIEEYNQCINAAMNKPTGFEPQLESLLPSWDQVGESAFQGVGIGTLVARKLGPIAGAKTAVLVTGGSILWGMGYRGSKNFINGIRARGAVMAYIQDRKASCRLQFSDVVGGRGR